MAVSAGTASLQVVPQLARQFSRDLMQQMAGPTQKAAKKTGNDAGRTFGKEFGGSTSRTAARSGNDAGRTFGKRFGASARVGLGPVTGIVRGFGGALAGAFAGVAVVSGLKSTIAAASDLQETLNKNKVVFGTSARSIEQWSRKSATSFGLSRNAALGAAAQFGEMFHQLGFTQKQAAKTSQSLVQTAADLGSFHNVDPSDVLERISAALRGEYDSLQQLIPNINAARVEQEALRATHKTSAKDITAAEKATAVLAIVQRDGANAAGDFAKTSDNAANRQRILAARVEDTKAAIGNALLPTWNRLLGFILEKFIPAVKRLVDTHGPALRTAFGNIRDAIGGMIAKARAWWETHGPAVITAFEDAKVAVFGVRGELDKTKQAWDDNSEAIGGLVDSVGDLTASTGLPSLETILKRIGEEVRGGITLVGWFARAWTTASTIVNTAVTFMLVTFLEANRTIFRAAATLAEALHLPIADGLRRAEQRMGAFVDDFKANSGEVAASAPGGSKSKFGGSLRAAEHQMSGFRSSFNASIGALHGKNITIPIKGTFQPPSGKFGSLHAIVGATGGLVTPSAIVHRANGGPIRMGTGPKADDVPAMLSRGEYVINAKATSKHRGLVEAINRDGLPGFAKGGQVDVDVLTPQMGRFGARIQRLIDTVGNRTAALLERRLRIFVGGVGKAAVTRFIKSTDPLPYIWGGAGPGGFDCSGLVGAVHLAHQGRPYGHGQRIYTTSSIRAGQYGLKPGLGGVLDIGVTSGTGHMAGRYGGKRGLGFEAESTRTGIKIGSAASSPESFARHFHLAKGGAVEARMVDALARVGALDVGGDAGKLRINGQTFDQGGTLSPGLNLLANRTGRPEPLVPPGQGIDYDRLGRAVALALRESPPQVHLDGRRMDKQLQTAKVWNARR